jgi:predicted nucleic acid-binding protein
MIAVDTGYFYALTDRRDAWHARALDCARRLDGEPMVTTWPVLTEACHLMAARLGTGFANELLADVVEGGISVWSPPAEGLARLPALMRKYASLPMDLADASLVLLAEHLGHGRILTTDTRDFGAYRWKSRKPFKNVLAEAA